MRRIFRMRPLERRDQSSFVRSTEERSVYQDPEFLADDKIRVRGRGFPFDGSIQSFSTGLTILEPSLCHTDRRPDVHRLFAAEPDDRANREHNEQCQNSELRQPERRLRLCRSELVEVRNLEERLHDQNEHIQVKRDHGADDVDPAPRANEAAAVACIDRRGQHRQRQDSKDQPRGKAVNGKQKPGHAGRDRGCQKKCGPAVQSSGGEEAGYDALERFNHGLRTGLRVETSR